MIVTVQSSKKLANGMYNITFSNNDSLKLYEDTVLKYKLLVGKSIDTFDIEDIIKFNNTFVCYNKAISYCMKYEKSELLVRKYLVKNKFIKKDINFAINKLYEMNLINDVSFGTNYANSLVQKGYGKFYIEEKLKYLGIKSNNISEILDNILDTDLVMYGKKIMQKQLKNYKDLDPLKQNLMIKNYLLRRGYNIFIINELVKE